MKTKRAYLIAAFSLLMMVLLVACTRSAGGGATKATEVPPQNAAEETIAPDATDVLSQIYIFATQTAMASGGVATQAPAANTPVPNAAATQPAAIATQKPAVLPTAKPGVIATAPPLVVPATYTLQKGEFPFCIARRFNVDPGALLRMNGLNSYSVYYAGMPLRIPQGGPGFPGGRALMSHPTSYSVRGGESLTTIACAFGDVDPNAIAVVNNLTPPYRLQVGQVLQIP